MAGLILSTSLIAWIDQISARNNLQLFTQDVTPLFIQTSGLTLQLLIAHKAVSQYAITVEQTQRTELEALFTQAIEQFQYHTQALESHNRLSIINHLLHQANTHAQAAFALGQQQLQLRQQQLQTDAQVLQQFEQFNSDWLFFEDDLQGIMQEYSKAAQPTALWNIEYLFKQGRTSGLALSQVPGIQQQALTDIQQELTQRFGTIVQRYNSLIDDQPALKPRLEPYIAALRQAIDSPQGLLQQQHARLQLNAHSQQQLAQLAQSIDQAQGLLQEMDRQVVQYLDRVFADAQYQMARSRTLIFGALLIALLISLLVGRNVVLSIRKPLKSTIAILDAMTHGDITQRIEQFNQDEFGRIGLAVNQPAQTWRGIITNIHSMSEQLLVSAQSAEQMSQNAQRRVDHQKQRTNSVADSVTHMQQAISDVAQHAEGSAHEVTEVSHSAIDNKQKIEGNIAAITELKQEINDASQTVNLLSESSNRIGSIIDVIKTIADQTNLLALNAAIEAARAGEQGRGFSVVADEVRNLASKTQASTEEIYTMITELHQLSSDTVVGMQKSQTKAEACMAQISQTGQAMDIMRTNLARIDNMSRSIADASEHQSDVAQDVARNILQIAQLTEEASSDVQNTANNSRELNTLALGLKSVVSQFKTD